MHEAAAGTGSQALPAEVLGHGEQWPRYGVLLVLVVASVAVQGAVPPGDVQQVVVSVLLAASILVAFRVARVRPVVMAFGWVVAAACIGVAVVDAINGRVGQAEVQILAAVLVALGPPAVGIGIVRNLRESGQVHIEAVTGVLALYLLLGMMFAFIYGAVDRLGGAPFFSNGAAATASHFLYFSLTTLTTVGYGDLTARTDLGHTLSNFEALIGQIYLVTVVSLIVSNLGRTRPRAA